MKIEITGQGLKNLKLIRAYFGKHDESCHEHFLFSVADDLIKKAESPIDHDFVDKIESARSFEFKFNTTDDLSEPTCRNLNHLFSERKVIAKLMQSIDNGTNEYAHAKKMFDWFNENINKLLGL